MKNKISSILFSVVLVVLLLSACTPAASSTQNSGYFPQMMASGTGEVFLTPDLAYVNIGVQSKMENVAGALEDNNAKAQAISQALTKLGVEAKDIQTSAFNIYPLQEYGPNGETLDTKYVVDNTVYVTVRDLQKLGSILDAVVKAGANSINGVQFDVTNKDTYVTEARRLAIEDAKATAQELADAAGIKLGKIISLNVYSTGSPTPMYEGKMGLGGGGSGVPVSSGQLSLTVNADISYEIK
jgi:uncharacterized protein